MRISGSIKIVCYIDQGIRANLLIPTILIPVILKYHELPFTAHQGIRRSIDFISRKYWWETMRNGITEFITGCDACSRRKTGHSSKVLLGDAVEADAFLDVVSLDIVEPLPVTERGHKYLLTL
jgi:hypothetical protein